VNDSDDENDDDRGNDCDKVNNDVLTVCSYVAVGYFVTANITMMMTVIITCSTTLSSWLSTVRGGLGRLTVHGPGFKFQCWPGNLGQDGVCVCFEINFSDRKEGSTVSSIMCDRWWVKH